MLVPKKNHRELQKAMEKMLYNPSLLKKFHQNAINKVVKSFDKNFVWQELKKEYENALGNLKLQKK